MEIIVQPEAFDPGAVLNSFTRRQTGAGAVVTFTGLVRDLDARLEALEIEHYAGMTERALTEIATEAMTRWPLRDVLILHRYGRLVPDAPIMMVATASAHRKAAFEAADFLMDYLKSRAPFWKKEHSAEDAAWVAAKDDDERALERWKKAKT